MHEETERLNLHKQDEESDLGLPSKLDRLGSGISIDGVGPTSTFELSKLELVKLFNFAFGNGTLLSSYFIVTLPIESKRISQEKSAAILGGFIFVAGITQLINPVVGLLSDRCSHKWGRRRPFIFYGALMGLLGLFMQLVARRLENWNAYLFAFTLSMIALNIIYSCMNGLIADLVSKEQIGQANGVIAMLTVIGAVSSFAVFQLIGGLDFFYGFYIACIAVTSFVTFDTAGKLEARQGAHQQLYPATDNIWREIKGAYYISPVYHRDFFLILVSRTLYYMGVSSQCFLMYFVRDTLHMSESESEKFTSTLAVAGQCFGVLTAFPVGYLSDRLANGRKKYIYASCAVMALGNIGFIGIASKDAIIVITCMVGAANGAYLTMDGALAFDALPNKDEAARFMGIWGIGAFIGTALGPLIGGPLLMANLDEDGTGYTQVGYGMLLTFSAIYLSASALTLTSTTVS
mmetsp:Transcript_22183/g.27101  ORF Transcript_22183/g.27101 Transcript_22183/m.27101 type:complete len:462 (+) Transcript_22183:150-1535(+)|eukprot:CAMPEP_0204837218 /NCGR_PEP_ID=MMETSP1346-20131115/27303_1 /ASSEMBLY_ACC=CAM_ASM_000771 /TAXON_ID=215587 /ORGANISM="Aplanochytrium stocchinoi, Strain GSBS06" /LENGTH=461 /DNA_ID=CAMNT_0051972521 /DNA_START=53 /DNA_END=1438 /DNA_ORIENTATION=-